MYAIGMLAIANVLDVLTGIIKALESKTLSSKAMKRGMVSKIFIWCMVATGGLIKHGLSNYLSIDFDPVPLIISYYMIMEILSILENVSEYLPIPDKIRTLFEGINEDTYKAKHKEGNK